MHGRDDSQTVEPAKFEGKSVTAKKASINSPIADFYCRQRLRNIHHKPLQERYSGKRNRARSARLLSERLI